MTQPQTTSFTSSSSAADQYTPDAEFTLSLESTTSEESMAVLGALFTLTKANLPVDFGVLAGRLGWGMLRVLRVLTHLQGLELVDRGRCALSLRGLSVAVACVASAKSASKVAHHRAA